MIFCFCNILDYLGVITKSDETTKNIGYNVLDLFSKCFREYSSGHV